MVSREIDEFYATEGPAVVKPNGGDSGISEK